MNLWRGGRRRHSASDDDAEDRARRGGGGSYRVAVPQHIQEGETFQVFVQNRIVRVRCPPGCTGGATLQLSVPGLDAGGAEAIRAPETPLLQAQSRSAPAATRNEQGQLEYVVAVPPGVLPNQEFPILIGDRRVMVTAPRDRSQQLVRVTLSTGPGTQEAVRSDCPPVPRPRRPRPARSGQTQLYEVVVPRNVLPGAPFSLMAGGNRVLVTCPENAVPGQRIRFELPLHLSPEKGKNGKSAAANFRMSYNKDGWMRVVRVHDLKFQWVRLDDGNLDEKQEFDIEKSAFVRSIIPSETACGVDLVPATKGAADSFIKRADGSDLVTFSDIVAVQPKPFEEKETWFRDMCSELNVCWDAGHIQLRVRRSHLLADSIDAVMSLSNPQDLRKTWRLEFLGEDGIDAGGLSREWFQRVCENIFDVNLGMWKNCSYNQMNMEINPCSATINPDDYQEYFRFVGRILGKALFDGQTIPFHLSQQLYKHILGWPVAFADLSYVDEAVYRSLQQLPDMEDIEMMGFDFTCTEDVFGCMNEVELLENGSEIDVTKENLARYLELSTKHKLVGQVSTQLGEFLRGFYEVIPETLLTIFDFQELELLMCGLPKIEMKDWRKNTVYEGDFATAKGEHQVCKWFWQVVADFDSEMKARLLQFVTASSGVPARGFAYLKSYDGNLKKFTINGVPAADSAVYRPVAHTCFNRIDLPCYETKVVLRDCLEEAVMSSLSVGGPGFTIE